MNSPSIRPIGAVPKKGKKQKAKEEVDRRGEGLKECVIQKQCEDLLNNMVITYIRIPDAIYNLCFGNTGRLLKPYIKKLISAFIKGVPDITILSKDGRFYCIELKTTKGKQSQGQKDFEKSVGKENYFIIRSVIGLHELICERNIK